MKVGDAVQVSVQGQKIIIEPLKKIRGKYNLRALVSRMPKDSPVEEVKWGDPVGKEACGASMRSRAINEKADILP